MPLLDPKGKQCYVSGQVITWPRHGLVFDTNRGTRLRDEYERLYHHGPNTGRRAASGTQRKRVPGAPPKTVWKAGRALPYLLCMICLICASVRTVR